MSVKVNGTTGVSLVQDNALLFVTRKNWLINGQFDIFQRAPVSATTASGYTFDRWYAGVGGTVTFTQQTTGVPKGAQYCGRIAYNASNSFANMFQALESHDVSKLVGKTVTLTAKLRRNASFTADIHARISKGSVADTLNGGTWTDLGYVAITNAMLPTGTSSTDWYYVNLTVAIPADGTTNGLRVSFNETIAGNAGAYWELANVCLVEGLIPIECPNEPYAEVERKCKRYYEKDVDITGINGFATGTAQKYISIKFDVEKRTVPTVTTYDTALNVNKLNYLDGSGNVTNNQAIGLLQVYTKHFNIYTANGAHTGFSLGWSANAEL